MGGRGRKHTAAHIHQLRIGVIHFRYKQTHRNTLVMKKYYFLAILVACTALFTGCQDDLVSNTTYNDGYLHFKFLVDNKGQWKDDGASGPQTRVMEPIEMTSSGQLELPLYLLCTETNEITPVAEDTTETRGERITKEAFDSRNKIQCFGVYGTVGSGVTDVEVLPFNTEIRKEDLTGADGDEWRVTNKALSFPDGDDWDDGEKGYFYGYAPYPGYDPDDASEEEDPTDPSYYGKGYAQCISVDKKSGTPTINFTMQPEEKKNKDILTARAQDVDKDGEVELEFRHVLTALRFKLDDGNDLTYSVKSGTSTTTFYVRVKQIKLEGIYKSGSVEIGKPFPSTDPHLYWTYEKSDKNIGDCVSTITRSRDDINNATDKLINTDENCFMVLPQETPKGAKVRLICDLVNMVDGTDYLKDVIFDAPLPYDAADPTKRTYWKPGYTYTYKISKDGIAREYSLDSNINSVTLTGLTAAGETKTFTVCSKVTKKTSGSEVEEAATWHIEYTEDDGTTWTTGLPSGFLLQKADGSNIDDLANIPGQTANETFKFVAYKRLGESTVLTELRSASHEYPADDGGYFDLSTHDFGYDGAQTARNTANCYIVNGYGKFRIPLVYGNAIKNGNDNPTAYDWFHAGKTYNGVTCPDEKGVFVNYKGNGITKPYINEDCATNASGTKLVWEDEHIIEESSLRVITDESDETSLGSGYKKQYLTFEIDKKNVMPGNAVIAVTDGTDIMWSWHIWVTVQDFSSTINLGDGFEIARYNIGWRDPQLVNSTGEINFKIRLKQNSALGSATTKQPVIQGDGVVVMGGSNLIYQQGRKDPFPNNSPELDRDASTWNDPSTKTSLNTPVYTNVDQFSGNGCTYTTNSVYLEESIKNPSVFYNHSASWFKLKKAPTANTGQYMFYLCWDPAGYSYTNFTTYVPKAGSTPAIEGDKGTERHITYNSEPIVKTIFDPSPVGFVVPNDGLLTKLLSKTFKLKDKVGGTGTDKDWPVPLKYIYWDEDNDDVEDENEKLKFYLCGCRRRKYLGQDGENHPFGLADYETKAYITQAMVHTNHYSHRMLIFTGTSGVRNNEYDVSRGIAVRPVKESGSTSGSSKPLKTTDLAGVSLTLNPGTDNYGLDYTTNATLNDLMTNASYSNQKVYVQNIVVTFKEKHQAIPYRTWYGYSGTLAAIAAPVVRTFNDFYVKYGNQMCGGNSWTEISRLSGPKNIPHIKIFNEGDYRRVLKNQDLTVVNNWKNLIDFDIWLMDIESVTADIRVTYYE